MRPPTPQPNRQPDACPCKPSRNVPPVILLDGISKSFDDGRTFAVRDLGLHIEDGETLILLGSSGCGKTTTLKMINRLVEPSAGRIEVDGGNVLEQDPIELRRSIGYVFQGIGLFPHLTVAQNVAVLLRLLGQPRQARQARAQDLLAIVDLAPSEFADRYPHELSGGQQQRVGVARALAADPPYLLMDEPFGALDAITRDALQQEVLELKQKLRKTIVFVTHDIFEALTLADRIAVMHEGRLHQADTIEKLAKAPATDYVRRLFRAPAEKLAAFLEQF